MSLNGRNILIGVSGGIAVYKTAGMVSDLRKQGADVRVVMTRNATEFVSPVTFQTLTGFPARTDLFGNWSENYIPHIGNAEWAEAIAVVPATANIIGKIAAGIADDLLTSTVIAADVPVLLAPSMNSKMYANPIVQQNMERLRSLGYIFIDPGWGRLACGTEGKGRLAPVEDIIAALERVFLPQDLKGINILVTAGGTREPIDPVRFISNRSSGKMGYAIAAVAQKRGAMVTLVSGPTSLAPPGGVDLLAVESAQEMLEACRGKFQEADVVIMAAAVADYMPESYQEQKIKKGKGVPEIILKPTPDIVSDLAALRTKQFIAGFAAETQDLVSNARKKLQEKSLDLMVANDVSKGIFGSDRTSILIMGPDEKMQGHENITKIEAAGIILDAVLERLTTVK